jgi:hypothetical protein
MYTNAHAVCAERGALLSVLSAFCVPVYPVTTSKTDKYSGLLTLANLPSAPERHKEQPNNAVAHIAAEMSRYDGHIFHRP